MKSMKAPKSATKKKSKKLADAAVEQDAVVANDTPSDALSGAVPLKSVAGLSKTSRKALEDRGFST
jgi:hypothetical protein